MVLTFIYRYQYFSVDDSSNSPLDSDNQKTQVLYGVENILNFTLNRFSLIKEKSDTCLDSSGPSVLVTTKPIWDSCKHFKKRGIRTSSQSSARNRSIGLCTRKTERSEIEEWSWPKM